MMQRPAVIKWARNFCITYPIIGLCLFLLQNVGFHFSSTYVGNLAWLLFLPSILFWLSWTFFLKSKSWRIIGSIANAVWAIPVSLLVVWMMLWTSNDLIIGNGHKFISERIVRGKVIRIYRAPDEGTFGGRDPYACEYKKLGFGLEYRKVLGKEWLPIEMQKEID